MVAYVGATGILTTDQVADPNLQDDSDDLDGNQDTDKLALVPWADLLDQAWPGGATLPVFALHGEFSSVGCGDNSFQFHSGCDFVRIYSRFDSGLGHDH